MRLSCAVLFCALAFPAAASADVVVTNEGLAITVQGDGSANHVTTSRTDDPPFPRTEHVLIKVTAGGPLIDSSELCEPADGGLRCTDPAPGEGERLDVAVKGDAGDDHLTDTAAWTTPPVLRPYGQDYPAVDVRLLGEAGDDDVRGVSHTVPTGGEGNDRVEGWFGLGNPGGAGDDVLVGTQADRSSKFPFNRWGQEPGNDLYVTTPSDMFFFDEGPITVSLDAQANDGRPGERDNIGNQAQMIFGSPQADLIDLTMGQVRGVRGYGKDGDDVVLGSAMHDFLDGGAGVDRIDGGGGDDELAAGDTDDVGGGAGRDQLYASGAALGYEISLDGLANDGVRGAATNNVRPDVEVIHGSDGPDRLVGADGAQELRGNGGDDELVGGEGPDLLYGGDGADQLRGRDAGWDLLDCGDGNDPSAEGDEGDHVVGCELSALAPLPDRRAPFLGINSVRRRSTGMRVQTYSDEKVALTAALRVGKRVLSRRSLASALGSRAFLLRLSAADRRRLRRARTTTVTVVATDAAGNATTRTRRIRLKR